MPTLGKGTLGTWRFHQCSAVPDTEPEPHRVIAIELAELPQFGPAKNILSGFCLTTWVWLVVKWFASDPGLRSLSSDRCKVACSEDQAPCKTVVDG